jgi:hypothetical protein
MYHLSRCIYRELAPAIVEDRVNHGGPTNHERVLRACEAVVLRMATDPHYFARPAKTLFNEIRIYFPMRAQVRVYRVVERYLEAAPLPRNGYCPSHQHLADADGALADGEKVLQAA